MQTASNILELITVLVFGVGFMVVVSAPMWIAGLAADKRREFERQLIEQAEIARKVAIAEAAVEARRRGEPFVPPADYDR